MTTQNFEENTNREKKEEKQIENRNEEDNLLQTFTL